MRPNVSFAELNDLANLLMKNNTLLWEALPLVYYHTDVGNVPQLHGLIFDANPKCHPALQSMCLLASSLCPSQSNKPMIASSLRSHWAQIWAWCSFFLKCCLNLPQYIGSSFPPEREAKLWEMIHMAAISLLDRLAAQKEFRLLMVSTPDLAPLLVQFWECEQKRPDNVTVSASNVLLHLFPPDAPHSWPDHSEMTVKIPYLCLQRIAAATKRVPDAKNFPPLYGDIYLLISFAQQHPLDSSPMTNVSIRSVLDLMRSLTIASEDAPTETSVCLGLIGSYLYTCFSVHGFPSIIHALENHLIVRMFKSAAAVQASGASAPAPLGYNLVYQDLLTTIAPFLIYRGVLLHARKSMKRLETLGMSSKLNASPFTKAWDSFKALADDRVRFKALHDSQYEGGLATKLCANPTVFLFTALVCYLSDIFP